jgi:transketolase
MSDVVVIGSINIDTVIQVDQIPELNEVSMGEWFTYVGGRGVNQAVAASRMGASVSIIATVGTDNNALTAIETLKANKVDTFYINFERSCPTGIAQITVDKNGNRIASISQGANQFLLKERIDECEKLIAESKIVLIQCEIPMDTILEAIHLAKKHNVKVILNNSPVRYFARDILNKIDFIVVSETGLNKMAGKSESHIESIEKTAMEIADTTFIIPQSHRQVLFISKDKTKIYKAPYVKAVDKTGYTGVLSGTIGALVAQGNDVDESVKFATVAMALSTKNYGAQPSAPYKLSVEAFMKCAEEEEVYIQKKIKRLKEKAKEIRIEIIRMLDKARSGHPGGSLSATEIITTLFFEKVKHNPKNPNWEERDRFILSKGHACPALYAALALSGYFEKKHLKTLREFGSILQGHPDRKHTPGVEVSTGSLGQGLSMANGMAIAGKLLKKNFRVFCLLSDGELEEGQIWEAAMTASSKKLDNLCAIVDFNGIQLSSTLANVKAGIEPIGEKFAACGWNVINVDGYDIREILSGLELAEKEKGRPTVLIAFTLKGRGVSFMERNVSYHGKVPSHEECEKAIEEILNTGDLDENIRACDLSV